LFSNGGVSVGNLFSGDAPTNIMVMSKVEGDRQSIKTIREYSTYFYSSLGFMRSLILSIAEMIKEVYQARRQISLGVTPRIKRHGSYIFLRAMTNVLMRDLQTNIVIQNMLKGVNSLYVDYLDYDEVAHHAGMARPESLASLRGLDWVVGMIDRARQYAPRKYELILVSDHGQSQGPTFKQLHDGKTLEMFINEYTHNSNMVKIESKPAEEQKSILTFL
jgi:predicted AlkP superfamily pyrophosphatase or phosphodiesterase